MSKNINKHIDISITGHHITVTPALEKQIHEKLAKITKYFDYINSIQVKLSLDNHHTESTHKGQMNHKAEVIMRVPGQELFAHAICDDMYCSVNQVTTKLNKQARKHKTKLKARKAKRFSVPIIFTEDSVMAS